ncbi:uncharacterized protein At1g32220, chloroplastic isoform X2 [Magnolia sinica]|uniref:uncharacterized protein At1g32220, chloroplastic isoform X2 n=1 Tax=Magnolia sinica TaxID=86752 RepID=UPI00265A0116|nr:uncharacterized protein At1g32220, chloroplastic isoform X2 [Magnolia sinica]
MKMIISRFLRTKSSIPRLYYATGVSRNVRLLSSDSNKVNEPFKVEHVKVEEAETINVPPPPSEKLLVLGGNGFVGSHVCREALDLGLSVSSTSRSGKSNIRELWADNVTWHQGNLLVPESLEDVLDGVTSVISCVGGFGSNSYMYKINGTANINAIRAAAEKGVKRFVYISAADFGVVNYLLKGYYEGKRAAEAELLSKFPYGGPPTCKTTKSGPSCGPAAYSSCQRDFSSKGCRQSCNRSSVPSRHRRRLWHTTIWSTKMNSSFFLFSV